MVTALSHFEFHCHACGAGTPLSETFGCPRCGGPLSLQLAKYPDAALLARPTAGLAGYRPFLPLPDTAPLVTLGEGATPLIGAPGLAAHFGLGAVQLKNEMVNPTGSFKDRQVAVGLSWARFRGFDTVAVVSSGNVAASAAAYAARAGMRAVLFMHGQAAPAKIAQAQTYGATVIAVDDPSPRSVFQLGIAACAERGWYHLSTAGIYEPWNVEGAKTIAYEIYQQCGEEMPDWVVAPAGGGGLVGGLWRGFRDLQAMGLIPRVPKMAAVQAAGCAPLVEAWQNGWSLDEHLAHPWAEPDTIAGAIADDILFDGHTVLPAIRETGGAAIVVTDDAMLDARGLLARTEGLLCEIASASAIAALTGLPALDKNTRVCCIVSGSGLKDLGSLAGDAAPLPAIPASLRALNGVPGI